MKPSFLLPRLLPVIAGFSAIAAPARAAQVETATEIHLTADLDGDGREDIVVLDRASGGFRAAYQAAPGVWTWSAARATGIAGVTGATTGKWFTTTRDSLAVVAPAANRAHVVQAADPIAQPTLTPIFMAGLGPSGVASPDIGGGGNTAHSDLWLASVENGAPNPVQTGTVRHNGTGFAALLQAPASRTPIAVRTLALKTGGAAWVCFLGTATAQPDRFSALSFASGAAVEVLAANVPAGSAWTSGRLGAGTLHHVLTWVPGETSFLSHAVVEGPPNVFSLAAAQAFVVTPPIGDIAIVGSDAGPRIVVTTPDGTLVEVYAFDGASPPAFLQSVLPPAGQSHTGLLPLAGGGFQLLQGPAGLGTTATMTRFTAAGGLFVAGTPGALPGLRPAALRANVFAFASEPFVDPAARLLARFNAPEWSSVPVLAGNQLSVTREIFGGQTAGLGSQAVQAIGTVPIGTAFALTNQFGTVVAVHSFDAGDGTAGAEVEISPVPGIQTRAIYLGFQPSPSTAPVFFRLDDGAWTAWNNQKVLLWGDTTVAYYARHPDTQQPSAIRTANYQFEAPPFELDSDGDGVPDFVEIQKGLDPLAGTDTDGDGFSDLNELLAGTFAHLAASKPGTDQRQEENIAFKLRAAPRPIDGSSGNRASAATGIRLEAFGLDGALLVGDAAVPLATPGVTGPGLLSDHVVADDRQGLIAVITEPVFAVTTASPDKDRGREIAGFLAIPTPAPPAVNYTPGGGTLAAETAAWIVAAQSAWNNQERPTVAGNWNEIDTLAALLLEWKIEQILIARGLSGLTPDRLTLFGGRIGDAGRLPPAAGDLAALRLRASPELPGYDLSELFQSINGAVAGEASLAVARAAATAIYQTSSAHANAAPPGTYLPPFDVLRTFVRGASLPAPYDAQVGIAAPELAAAQAAMAALITGLPARPVATLTLVVQPDSFAGGCHRLLDKATADPVNLFAAPGLPYQATDGFTLIPGTELLVTGYSDLVAPCPGTNLEVISVVVVSFPALPAVDQDNNLLPDAWEWVFLLEGGGDPYGDNDNDGILNLQESLDGTDPLDPESKAAEALIVEAPQLGIAKDGFGGVILSWKFPPAYADAIIWSLQTSVDLAGWAPQAATINQPQPGNFSIALPGVIAGDSRGFYRVVMALAP
jgi:hypothetical protein